MKTCDEMMKHLTERKEQYIVIQKQRRRLVSGIGLSACAVCCAVMLCFGLWQWGSEDPQIPMGLSDALVPGISDYVGPTESDGEPVRDDPAQIAWVVNAVDRVASAAKLHFGDDQYYGKKMSDDALTEYYGQDLSDLEKFLPDGYVYSRGIQTTFYYKNDGTLVYDVDGYSYEKDDISVMVWASKIGAPYDYVYHLDDPTISEVNGVDVLFGGVLKHEDADDYDLLFADFTCGDLQYRVTVENHASGGLDTDVKPLQQLLQRLLLFVEITPRCAVPWGLAYGRNSMAGDWMGKGEPMAPQAQSAAFDPPVAGITVQRHFPCGKLHADLMGSSRMKTYADQCKHAFLGGNGLHNGIFQLCFPHALARAVDHVGFVFLHVVIQ